MSNVSDIVDAIGDNIKSLLGNDWKEMRYVYDIEKNDARTINKSYGVGVGSADTVTSTIKAVTFDQEFFIVLAKKFVNKNGDGSQRIAINELYDSFEVLNKNMFQKKVGLSSIILVVQDISMDEPEVIDGSTISLRARYIIKHRKETT